jgi:hypothetical protein
MRVYSVLASSGGDCASADRALLGDGWKFGSVDDDVDIRAKLSCPASMTFAVHFWWPSEWTGWMYRMSDFGSSMTPHRKLHI